jgi:hypothetical protein
VDTITFLQKQLANINSVLHSVADDLTDPEWLARPGSGQNMIGFTVWHIPRTQDAVVQTWIRGIPEISSGNRWNRWSSLLHLGNGVGIPLVDADEIARRVLRAEVMNYADEVLYEISSWLEQLHESDLDRLPEIRQHMSSHPEYQTPEYLKETGDLFDQPIWGQLMRPCVGHIHRHLGELEIAKALLRTRP